MTSSRITLGQDSKVVFLLPPAKKESHRTIKDIDETGNSSTEQQYSAFLKCFDYFNKTLFSNDLPQCLLTHSKHGQAVGYFSSRSWANTKGDTIHEISICPLSLHHPPEIVMSILVHECVHLWQHELGCPGRGKYHNREWANKMIELGLMPSTTGKPGGKQVGNSMSHYIIEGGKFQRAFEFMPEDILMPWKTKRANDAEKKDNLQALGSRNKNTYFCPNCNLTVWGKMNLGIRCEECRLKLKVRMWLK